MAEFIVMPKLGFDMREGVLVRWLKEVGEAVNKGDIVAEIESDKATLELESQVTGTLLQTMGAAGDIIPVGANLAIVGEAGEDVSGMNGDTPAKKEAPQEEPAAKAKDKDESKAEPQDKAKAEPKPEAAAATPSAAVSDEFPGGVKATPVARRVAKEQNVDLAQVSATGPDGRIRKADVEAFLQAKPEAKTPAAAAPTPAAPKPTLAVAGEDDTEVPATKLRQAIARRMTESKTTVPHFYVTSEIDMEAALALRKQINAMLPDEEKVTVNDLIVKATALALRDYPNLNASFAGDKFVRHNRINIGVAVAVEGGLLTVVGKDTDKTSVSQIAAANKTMIARARSGKVNPNDIEGATFTVSNLGAFDVENFIAIINPPDAAILAVGSARQVPVVKDGQIVIGTMMKVTISADHRVTDGAEAAQYLQKLKSLLENPMRLLL